MTRLKWWIATSVLTACVAACGGGDSSPAAVKAPDVTLQTRAAAVAAIEGAGLKVGEVTSATSETVPEGQIISANPPAGSSLAAGTVVDLVISSGPAPIAVPDVVGQVQETAAATISGAGLIVTVETTETSSVASGTVISETPAAISLVAPGSAVVLVVAFAPPTTVPAVTDVAQATAVTILEASGLVLGTLSTDYSAMVAAGLVISQSPEGGVLAASGSEVDIVVSKGPPLAAVPNIAGFTVADATATLNKSGFIVGNVTQLASTKGKPRAVVSQDPAAAAMAAAGSAINLVVTPPVEDLSAAMTTTRRFHTATLLLTGKVLLAGGRDVSGNDLASAELYDPETHTFVALQSSMTTRRTAHTATLLHDGTVLIAGGVVGTTGAALDSAELYDPSTQTFVSLAAKMTASRYSHVAAALANGVVLIANGFSYDPNQAQSLVLNSAEVFDPVTLKFETILATTSNHAINAAATSLPDGTILLTGGEDGYQYKSVELYSPVSQAFSVSTAMLTTSRAGHSATLLDDGTVLLIGGFNSSHLYLGTMEVYDLKLQQFLTRTDTLPYELTDHTATLLIDGMILIAGGYTNSGVTAKAVLYVPPSWSSP